MRHIPRLLILFLVLTGCQQQAAPGSDTSGKTGPELVVLGIAQDAGYPQIDCQKSCCERAWSDPAARRKVVSLGLYDPESGGRWLLEATPDLREQLRTFDLLAPRKEEGAVLDGIFLSHAHMGHYTGLMHLGREAMGAKGIPVYAMPRMSAFLRTNGPWSQLVDLENIRLRALEDGQTVELAKNLKVTPVLVPHRDEFSETVGFRIEGPGKRALFIPDIDKWEKWGRDIREEIKQVDYAFLDATFFQNGEIPGRDMSEIPHPFVAESMAMLGELDEKERGKVYFIHFNHTNPLLDPASQAVKEVEEKGFHVAAEGMRVSL